MVVIHFIITPISQIIKITPVEKKMEYIFVRLQVKVYIH